MGSPSGPRGRRRRRRSARRGRRPRGRGRRAGRRPRALRVTARLARFSSRYFSLLVPGMGTTSSPLASTQARASWGAVQPFASAISKTGRARSEVGLDVPGLEARRRVAPVVRGEVGGGAEAAGQQAAAERAVGHEADPELAAGGERTGLVVAGEERVLALQRADRVDGVRAPQRGGRGLGEAEEPHLARADELGHGADRLLDRRLRVDAVLVVEVDRVETEPLQAGVAGRADVLGAAAHAAGGGVRAADDPELRGHHDSLAAAPRSARPTSSSFVCGP